jgi:hypothetical protein
VSGKINTTNDYPVVSPSGRLLNRITLVRVQQKDEGKNIDRMSKFTLTGLKEREKKLKRKWSRVPEEEPSKVAK